MKKISIIKNFNEVVAGHSIEEIVAIIRSNKFQGKIENLRIILNSGNEKAYSDEKKSLPAFTPSGEFEGGRKLEFLKTYSQIIILDIDKIDESTLNIAKEKAQECNYTLCCFVSPSGKGLKILVKVISGSALHKQAYEVVKLFYENLLNVTIDKSGKDITRLCFMSYDPEIFYNADALIFKITETMKTENDVKKVIEQIDNLKIDITSNYSDWCNIGFALESEFGENGRYYFHAISRNNPDYILETCNEQYTKCINSSNSGITIKTLFHIAKQHGIVVRNEHPMEAKSKEEKAEPQKEQKVITSNKFTITEEYLNQRFDIRYNVISNKFEYKDKEEENFREMNENNMFVRLQKDNINISLNHLIALLKSDFVKEHHVFRDYFEKLPKWDGETDYIGKLCSYLLTDDRKRLENHFKKWLVRAVRNSIDDNYFNKQAFVLVSIKQNSGKSTFCRFLCPRKLNDYIAESIGTDKDSQIAITENFLINMDELSQAEKAEINAFKSMFSKDKVKARLTYDKRPTVHARRANFIGSTDRWEFLTDENGSVRWLCFEITSINWNYTKEIDINLVWSQAYHLLSKTKFVYDLTPEEIQENDWINKKFQVSSTERDLIIKYFKPATEEKGFFKTATDLLEYIADKTRINLQPSKVGKELRFLGFERRSRRISKDLSIYGYYVEFFKEKEKMSN